MIISTPTTYIPLIIALSSIVLGIGLIWLFAWLMAKDKNIGDSDW